MVIYFTDSNLKFTVYRFTVQMYKLQITEVLKLYDGMYTCMCVCMYVCMYMITCMCVCVYVCMCTSFTVVVCTHTRLQFFK
jgi:hypothetical protein